MNTQQYPDVELAFLKGSGEMASLTRNFDWDSSILGSPKNWPQSLKTTLGILLNSKFPMFLMWGPELICFYNDAFRPSLGNNGKHPEILGTKAEHAWMEIWNVINPLIDKVTGAGEAIYHENLFLPIFRNGKMEDVYWTFSYSPVINEAGMIEGVLVTCMETTNEVQTITRLQQAERRFQNLVQDAVVGIVILTGKDLVVREVNDSYARLVNRNVGQLLNKPLFEVIPETEAEFRPLIDKVRLTGVASNYYEKEYWVYDGEQKIYGYVNIVYQPFHDELPDEWGVMILCQDVKQQVIWRKEIETALEQVRLSKEAAQLGLFDLDLEQGTMIWDDRCRHLFGIDHHDTVSYEKDFAEGLHPDDKVKILELIERLYTDPSTNGDYDVEYRTIGASDRRVRWVRAKGKVYYSGIGKPVRFIGSVLDITDQKQAEQRKSDFIGMVSHELKTPLTLLKGYLQLLKLKSPAEIEEGNLRMINQSENQINKMVTLINGFLNVSRLESDKIHLNRNDFDLAELVREVEAESMLIVQSHRVQFDDVSSCTVNADAEKIGQVIHNLIGNAVKYSRNGSVVRVKVARSKDSVKILVSDEGIGISKQDIPFVFERFYRVNGSPTKNVAGFGIGLYVSAEIIARHHGQIGVESEIGKGSTFWFTLPLTS